MAKRVTKSKPEGEVKVGIRESAQAAEAQWEESVKKLWKVLKTATPEKKKKIVENLDEKTITALRTMNNPMKKPVIDDGSNRYLAFSAINLTEKYSQRFAMTSCIGFIYRMLDEYEPEESKQYVSENSPEFANIYNKKVKEYKRNIPDMELRKEFENCKEKVEQLKEAVKLLKQDDGPDAVSALQTKGEALKAALKESYVIRSKIAKYQLYLVGQDIKEAKEESEKLGKELKVREADLKVAQDEHSIALTRFQKKLKLEEVRQSRLAERKAAGQPPLEETDESQDPQDPQDPQASEKTDETSEKQKLENEAVPVDRVKYEDPDEQIFRDLRKQGKKIEDLPSEKQSELRKKMRTLLNFNDMRRPVSSFDQEVRNKQASVSILEHKIQDMRGKIKNYENTIAELEKTEIKHEEFVANIRKEYDEKIRASSTNKDKVKKLAKKDHPLEKVEVETRELNEDEYDKLAEEVKKQLNITKTAEEYTEDVQNGIEKFLNKYFVYNPDNHVRCSYKPNYDDPTRTPIDVEKERKEKEAKYERLLWPPDDTFHRWNRYIENNYEELRQATDDIYCEKSDFEYGIVPYKVFEGKDEKKVQAEIHDFQRKYADEFEADILVAKFFNWNLMGSWAQNRELRDFYNKNTEIIKRILDQNKEDMQMGAKLMKDRANKKKAENEKEAGPHSKGFTEVGRHMAKALEQHGAKPVEDIVTKNYIKNDAPIPVDSVPKDQGESTKDEVEVGVHVIRPELRKGKRRMRGHTDQSKFHIPAEKLPEGGLSVTTPAEQRWKDEENAKKEAKAAKKGK